MPRGQERMPDWLRRPLATPGRAGAVEGLLGELRLNSVCQSAKCPNRGECFSRGTATFLILGDLCTRGCRFCAVERGEPASPDPEEPARVAEAARRMGLAHVVVTMVTRDDLADGGAAHVARVVRAVRAAIPDASVEVLVSDFAGDSDCIDLVIEAGPDVFNHNVETVPRLYPQVRPEAQYERSLDVLRQSSERLAGMRVKSGLMLGLGETPEEVFAVLRDLRSVGCEAVTIGQYLQPSPAHLPVAQFVKPVVFEELKRCAKSLGFSAVASAPFVRSSYHAKELAEGL